MPTKPTTLPRWATNLTNNTAPSVGQMDTGWTVGQDGVSSYDNYIKYWAYKWFEWLNTGDIGAITGATTYTGTASVALTADQINLDPLGTGSTALIHTIYVTPDIDDRVIRGLVGGVDGREIDIINIGTKRFGLLHQDGTCLAANRLSFPYTVRQDNGRVVVRPGGRVKIRYVGSLSMWVVLDMTGCAYLKVTRVPIAAARESAGTRNIDEVGGTTPNVQYPLIVSTGDVIEGWTLYFNKASTNAYTVGASLLLRDGNDISATTLIPGAGGANNTANAPGYTTIVANTYNLEVQNLNPNASYYLRAFSTATASEDRLLNVDFQVWTAI